MVRGDSAVGELCWNNSIEPEAGFDRFLSSEPTPDSLVELNELVCILLQRLENATLRRVAQLKLSGSSNREIADELEVSERTVERKLVRIRTLLTMLGEG
jgi:DNA-directed RNA polymerase specialized sigma24 family protein